MDKYIIVPKSRLDELHDHYKSLAKWKGKEEEILEILRKEILMDGKGILYQCSYDKIRIYSKDMELTLNFGKYSHSIRVLSCRKIEKEYFIKTLVKCDYIEGPFFFITDGEARTLEDKNGRLHGTFQNVLRHLMEKEESKVIHSKTQGFREYEKYWESIDLLKKYEYEDYLEKQKESISPYSNLNISYDNCEITLTIEKTEHSFRTEDALFIAPMEVYDKENIDLDRIFRIRIGTFKSFKDGKKKIVINTTNEIIKIITGNNKFKKGIVYYQNIGYLSKLRREKEALEKLYLRETANNHLKDFLPGIQEASVISKEINQGLLSHRFLSLEEKQKDAVLGALGAEDIYFIQGPPGTGKTTVISEIITYLIGDGKKVLLSSQTNLAVDNVLQRIGEEEGVKAIRIGREEKFELDSANYSLENRVLDLQKQMITDTEKKMEAQIQRQEKEKKLKLIYESHLAMKDALPFLLLLSIEKEVTQNETKINLKDMDEMKKRISQLETMVESLGLTSEKQMKALEMLRSDSHNLGCTSEALHQEYRLYLLLSLTSFEEKLLWAYDELQGRLNGQREREDALQNQKIHTERSMAQTITELNALNEQLKNAHRGIASGFGERMIADDTTIPMLKNLYKTKDEHLKQLVMKKQDTEDLLSQALLQGEAIYKQTLDASQLLQPVLDTKKSMLKQDLNINFITKSRFLELYKQKNEFRKKISVEEADLHYIAKLADYEKSEEYINELSLLKNQLKKEDQRTEDLLEKLHGCIEKTAYTLEGRALRAYLDYYALSVETISAIEEEKTCALFIQEYQEDQKLRALHEKTMDIKKDWMKALGGYHPVLEDIYIETSNLICATCLGIASSNNNHFLHTTFDYVIIDEAARASSLELLIPLVRGKTVVLVGDHKQINPEVERSILERMERGENIEASKLKSLYNQALFGKLYAGSPEILRTFLNKQFRMHSDISYMVSKFFYEGELRDGTGIESKRHGIKLFYGSSLFFVPTPDEKHFQEIQENSSYKNVGEAETVLTLLHEVNNNLTQKKTVGIIAPYRAQINLLNEILKNQEYENLEVEVNTIDAFQGREKEIILLSMVRNNAEGRVGHLGEHSRMNVALSRAQELLLVIGNGAFFKKSTRAKKIATIISELERKGMVYTPARVTYEVDHGKHRKIT